VSMKPPRLFCGRKGIHLRTGSQGHVELMLAIERISDRVVPALHKEFADQEN